MLRRLYAKVAELGVGTVHICGGDKVEYAYWGSRETFAPERVRENFLKGLEQAGDTHLPDLRLHKSRRLTLALKAIDEHQQSQGHSHPNKSGDGTYVDHNQCVRTVRLFGHPDPSLPRASELLWAGRAQGVSNTCPPTVTLGPNDRILAAIGPEGGWTDEEINELKEAGFQGVSMGSRTLTTTTATIALLTLAHEALSVTSKLEIH